MLPASSLSACHRVIEVLRDQHLGELLLVLERGLAMGRRGLLNNAVSLASSTRLLRLNRSTNLWWSPSSSRREKL